MYPSPAEKKWFKIQLVIAILLILLGGALATLGMFVLRMLKI